MIVQVMPCKTVPPSASLSRLPALRPPVISLPESWVVGWDARTSAGRPVSPVYVRQMVRRYAQRGGLEKDVHPHTLRHTAATTWLRRGFNPREVQKLLGHSSAAMTELYTHVFDEDLQRKQRGLAPLAL